MLGGGEFNVRGRDSLVNGSGLCTMPQNDRYLKHWTCNQHAMTGETGVVLSLSCGS